MDQLTIVIEAIQKLNEKLELYNQNKYFIFEHQKNILLKDISFEFKRSLKLLFGEVKNSDSYGVYEDLFFSDSPGYMDKGVMFSYWSFSGVPYNSSKTKNGEWRENLFYKGIRYSNARLRNNFYDLFNVLSKECSNSRFDLQPLKTLGFKILLS